MPRYEHDGRFWTITQEGSVLTITSGKLGNKGRTVVKHHASEAAAVSAHDQLVLEKHREGYRLAGLEALVAKPVEVPAEDERGPALEAAIEADPTDANAFAVYGDWLHKLGDPRGELIALQQAAAKPVAVGKHIATHAAQLLGPLAALVHDVRIPDAAPFFWRNGFIYRAELATAKKHALDAVLPQLFAHPSARFLVELALRADDRKDALAALAVVHEAAPPTLREFDLFARANLDRIDDGIWKSLSKLERLGITARAYELGTLALPALKRARFFAGSMSSSTLEAIARAPWPVLERLELRFCGPTGSCEAELYDLRPFLHRTDMPALTHLRLRGCAFAGAIARELAGSPLARQLHVLDFSHGDFTPQDVAFLAKCASNFPNLKELWMPFERMSKSLEPVAKHVIPDSRGPVDTLDYDLAGERVPRGDRYEGIRE